jgi:hypothetical protein
MYNDLDVISKKEPVPEAVSNIDIDVIKAKSASSPKTCAEIIKTGKLKFFIFTSVRLKAI